jgi:hypothetical protein
MKQKTPGYVEQRWWVGEDATCKECRATYVLDADDTPKMVNVQWPSIAGWLGLTIRAVAVDCPECNTKLGLIAYPKLLD